ncbi:porin [Stenotrophomonas sp. STM01]|uniref:OprO/OprP family phosphate-selective porin n=1 Tax=Stenotrophomonas sp. STM01 TaxID=2769278 RepID=UPI001CE0C854|nr:porin [Stenotrophomonas sp. STM01]
MRDGYKRRAGSHFSPDVCARSISSLPNARQEPSMTAPRPLFTLPTRKLLSLSLALAVCGAWSSAQAQQLTVEQLQQRLERLERLAGVSDGTPAEGAGLADLDQRLRIIERRLELQEEERVAAAKAAPKITVDQKGASFKSGDGNYELKLRGLLQGDARVFVGNSSQNDTFLLRTARPTLEGSLGKRVAYRFTPEFAGDSATIVDAYADLRFDPAYTVRVGKFTSPVGLERLQSSAALVDVERALVSELAPNRDLGVQLQGELGKGRFSYAVGVFNGTVDGRDAVTSNPDDDFEYAGRVFFEPLKGTDSAWAGLGFGLGASAGQKHGSGNNFLPRYRSPGQATFFNYRSAVIADGDTLRWSPQGWFYRNGFGLQAEYIASRQEVARDARRTALEHRAWQATASYVLSGEDASYRGVTPSRPFGVNGGRGAFELTARYGELEIDEAAFPFYADPATSASHIRAWTVGANWYLTPNLKLATNYLQSRFDATAGAARLPDEKAVFSRLQVSF